MILSSDFMSFLDVASKFYFILLRPGYKENMIKEVFKLTSFDQRSDIISRISIRRQNARVISAAPPIVNLVIPYVARSSLYYCLSDPCPHPYPNLNRAREGGYV